MDAGTLSKGFWRRLYPAATAGRRINAVSAGAERCFWRANMIADDLGNFPADPDRFAREAFKVGALPPPHEVAVWLAELADIHDAAGKPLGDLVTFYEAEGESYGHIVGFEVLQPLGFVNKNPRKPVQKYPAPHSEGKAYGDPSAVRAGLETTPNDGPEHDELRRATIGDERQRSVTNGNGRQRPEDESEDSERKNQTNPKSKSADGSDSLGSARQDFSGSGSGRPLDLGDPHLARLKGRQRWLVSVSRLWTDRKPGQRDADETSSKQMFDDIWPEDSQAEHGAASLVSALALVKQAGQKDTPMAWLTARIKKELAHV